MKLDDLLNAVSGLEAAGKQVEMRIDANYILIKPNALSLSTTPWSVVEASLAPHDVLSEVEWNALM